jgi:hypothetical protein
MSKRLQRPELIDFFCLSLCHLNLILTLVNTAKYDIAERMSLHIPISDALNGIGRLYFDKNFHASKRNSIKLLIKANNGARLELIYKN